MSPSEEEKTLKVICIVLGYQVLGGLRYKSTKQHQVPHNLLDVYYGQGEGKVEKKKKEKRETKTEKGEGEGGGETEEQLAELSRPI